MPDAQTLTNHEITITLDGGAVLGPYKATWSTALVGDVRELTKDYDAFLNGKRQSRFKYHLHDQTADISHSLVISFENVTAIYDRVHTRHHET